MLQIATMAPTKIHPGAKLHAYVSEHLRDRGMNQERLASLMDVHPSTITGYKQANWDIETSKLAHIAYCLGLDNPLDLFKPPAPRPEPRKRHPMTRPADDRTEIGALAAEVAKLTRLLSKKK